MARVHQPRVRSNAVSRVSDLVICVTEGVSVKLVRKKDFVYICILLKKTKLQFIDIDDKQFVPAMLSKCQWSRFVMRTHNGAHVFQLGGALSQHDKALGDERYYKHVRREGMCFRVSRKYKDEHMHFSALPSDTACPSAKKDLHVIVNITQALRTIDVRRGPFFALYLAAMLVSRAYNFQK